MDIFLQAGPFQYRQERDAKKVTTKVRNKKDQGHPGKKVLDYLYIAEIKLGMTHINPVYFLRQFTVLWQVLFSFCK